MLQSIGKTRKEDLSCCVGHHAFIMLVTKDSESTFLQHQIKPKCLLIYRAHAEQTHAEHQVRNEQIRGKEPLK